MKVGIISRYPPMEGGVSSDTYWMAKHLGERGIECIVITDNWCIDEEYKEKIDPKEFNKLEPKNVKVYSVDPLFDANGYRHRKGMDSYLELLSLALEAYSKENIEVWYANYFFPYGIVSTYLRYITKRPVIIRHAGSDLNMLKSPYGVSLLEAIKNADKIISHDEDLQRIFGDKVIPIERIAIPPEFDVEFKPLKSEKIKIGLTGKFDSSKRVAELCKALYELDENKKINRDTLEVRYLTSLSTRKNLVKIFPSITKKYFKFYSFRPPWHMPEFYQCCDIFYAGEKGFPIRHHFPITPLEAVYVGVPTIISDELYEKYERVIPDEADKMGLITVDTSDYSNIYETLENITQNPRELIYLWNKNRKAKRAFVSRFNNYFSKFIQLLAE